MLRENGQVLGQLGDGRLVPVIEVGVSDDHTRRAAPRPAG